MEVGRGKALEEGDEDGFSLCITSLMFVEWNDMVEHACQYLIQLFSIYGLFLYVQSCISLENHFDPFDRFAGTLISWKLVILCTFY